MPEKRCWHCGVLFEFDSKDIRPFIYHNCRDGSIAGRRNPNMKRVRRQWVPPPKTKEQVLNKRLKDFYGGA